MTITRKSVALTLFLSCFVLIHIAHAFPPQTSGRQQELDGAARLNETVLTLFQEKKFDEALVGAKRVLDIRRRLLSPDDPLLVNALNNVGEISLMKGALAESKKAFQESLEKMEKRLGPNEATIAPILDRLGTLYFRTGELPGAETTYKRALALKEAKFGPNSMEVGTSLYYLGELYRSRRNFIKGIEVLKRALTIYELHSADTAMLRSSLDAFACMGFADGHDTRLIADLWRPVDSKSGLAFVGLLNGKALSLPKPRFPKDEMAANFTKESVVVSVTIDETGKVIEAVDLCQAATGFSEASLASARAARFAPTLLNGQPIKVMGVINYHFIRK